MDTLLKVFFSILQTVQMVFKKNNDTSWYRSIIKHHKWSINCSTLNFRILWLEFLDVHTAIYVTFKNININIYLYTYIYVYMCVWLYGYVCLVRSESNLSDQLMQIPSHSTTLTSINPSSISSTVPTLQASTKAFLKWEDGWNWGSIVQFITYDLYMVYISIF